MKRSRFTFRRSCLLLVLCLVLIGAALVVMMAQINGSMTPAMDDALYQMQTRVRAP